MNMEYTELKIRMMQQGAVFTPCARSKMCQGSFGRIYFSDYPTTSGVILEIEKKIYVNVPVKTEDTPFCIDFADDRFVLEVSDVILRLRVEVMKEPDYALTRKCLKDNITPVRELVMTHGDRLRISPIFGCSHHCLFCTCNNQKYKKIPIDALDQAVQIALEDKNNKPLHVLISGGTPQMNEKSYAYMNQVYLFFPNKYKNLKFDVMLSPRVKHIGQPKEKGYEDFLFYLKEDCKIATMSINLELFNEEKRKKYIYEKWKIGKEDYFWFIKKAVDIFGSKNIRSSLVVGLETKEDTLNGVKALIDCGCVPVLSAFVPAADVARKKKPDPGFLLDVVHEASKIARQNDTMLGPALYRVCTHNSLTDEEGSVQIPDEIYRAL